MNRFSSQGVYYMMGERGFIVTQCKDDKCHKCEIELVPSPFKGGRKYCQLQCIYIYRYIHSLLVHYRIHLYSNTCLQMLLLYMHLYLQSTLIPFRCSILSTPMVQKCYMHRLSFLIKKYYSKREVFIKLMQ